jgi:hypothetical protein
MRAEHWCVSAGRSGGPARAQDPFRCWLPGTVIALYDDEDFSWPRIYANTSMSCAEQVAGAKVVEASAHPPQSFRFGQACRPAGGAHTLGCQPCSHPQNMSMHRESQGSEWRFIQVSWPVASAPINENVAVVEHARPRRARPSARVARATMLYAAGCAFAVRSCGLCAAVDCRRCKLYARLGGGACPWRESPL